MPYEKPFFHASNIKKIDWWSSYMEKPYSLWKEIDACNNVPGMHAAQLEYKEAGKIEICRMFIATVNICPIKLLAKA